MMEFSSLVAETESRQPSLQHIGQLEREVVGDDRDKPRGGRIDRRHRSDRRLIDQGPAETKSPDRVSTRAIMIALTARG
jgi:hypothetical protein